MAWVDRDGAGSITAAYGIAQQPGQEKVPDTDPALVAFRNRRKALRPIADIAADLETWIGTDATRLRRLCSLVSAIVLSSTGPKRLQALTGISGEEP